MATSRTILKPQTDVPLRVKLDYGPEGKEKPGNYGTDYQYTVNGDMNLMYLPLEARNELIRTQAQAGDRVEILKGMYGKKATWRIQVLSDAQEPPAPSPAPAPGPRIVAPSPAQRNYQNGAAARQLAPAASHPIPQSHPMEELMARCFVVAAHALKRAYDELTAEGMEWDAPIWDDVRATGISLFIERNKQRGER